MGRLIASFAVAFLFVSCAGEVHDSEEAAKRLINGYGGRDGVEMLQSFSGKGFMKDIASTSVVKNYPFDLYRKGPLYKSKMVRLSEGKPTQVRITLFGEEGGFMWESGKSRGAEVPAWQRRLVNYMFPMVLKWIQEPTRAGEIIATGREDGFLRVRYNDGNDLITLSVDRSTWLLHSVELGRSNDSSFVYTENYGDYRRVDGVPFPNRIDGRLGNRKLYEFFLPVIEIGADLPDTLFSLTPEDSTALNFGGR